MTRVYFHPKTRRTAYLDKETAIITYYNTGKKRKYRDKYIAASVIRSFGYIALFDIND